MTSETIERMAKKAMKSISVGSVKKETEWVDLRE